MTAIKQTYATGRRKASSARVYLAPADGEPGTVVVNERAFEQYFPNKTKQMIILQPIAITERNEKYNVKVMVSGGGVNGQAGAVRHGIARALEREEPELRPILKKAGLLTRDPRVVERKKPGRHKARKKPQFSKR